MEKTSQSNRSGDNIAGDSVNVHKQINEINHTLNKHATYAKDIKSLGEKVDKLEKMFSRKQTIVWVSGFSVLVSIIALCGAFIFKNTVIVEESIVLVFVGALATFVVVGNYMQVQDVKREFGGKVWEVKTEQEVLRSEFKNAINAAKLEVFCEGTRGVLLEMMDGKSFENKFYLSTQAFIAASRLCDDYNHTEYKENADYFFGLVEILMNAAKENENTANFSEIKLEELISNVSPITDFRAKEIYEFLWDFRKRNH
jgi:hypothetical protein